MKYTEMQRMLIFIMLCVPIRLTPPILMHKYPIYSRYFPILYIIGAIGFAYSYMYSTKTHGAFGGVVWWNNLRLLNAIMYTLFAIGAWYGLKNAHLLLIPDVIIGLLIVLYRYFLM